MSIMQFERRRICRGTMIRVASAGVCNLVACATVFSQTAKAAGTESAKMVPTELIKTLRLIGTPVCLDAADRLATSTGSVSGSGAGFNLHLRQAGLTKAHARVLANAMLQTDARERQENHTGGGFHLKSFSASYNPYLGDVGATGLSEAFPDTLTELGMVGCSVGDVGGRSILKWARTAPDLRMICVEGNDFSAGIKSEFQDLGLLGRNMLVVV